MTRDFKGRATLKQKGKAQRSCLFWFVTGTLLGAFAVGLLWLQLDPALWRSGSGLATTGVPRPQVDDTERAPPSTSLEFEFPDLLREMVVQVPDEKEPAPPAKKPVLKPKPEPAPAPAPAKTVAKAEATKSKPAAAPPEREAYMLQVGSFRKPEDAERLKARLAFMGIETRIQKVTIDGRSTFHRVRSGPYRNHKELDEVRRLLTRNKIKSVVIRWRS